LKKGKNKEGKTEYFLLDENKNEIELEEPLKTSSVYFHS
jgi:hypothetical protein